MVLKIIRWKENPFSILPEEILHYLFTNFLLDEKLLGRCACVCKSWRRIADDDTVWALLCRRKYNCSATGVGMMMRFKIHVKFVRQRVAEKLIPSLDLSVIIANKSKKESSPPTSPSVKSPTSPHGAFSATTRPVIPHKSSSNAVAIPIQTRTLSRSTSPPFITHSTSNQVTSPKSSTSSTQTSATSLSSTVPISPSTSSTSYGSVSSNSSSTFSTTSSTFSTSSSTPGHQRRKSLGGRIKASNRKRHRSKSNNNNVISKKNKSTPTSPIMSPVTSPVASPKVTRKKSAPEMELSHSPPATQQQLARLGSTGGEWKGWSLKNGGLKRWKFQDEQNGDTILHAEIRRTTRNLKLTCAGKEILIALVEHGQDVNTKNTRGVTPLHLAAEAGCPLSTMLLVTHGADVNAMDDNEMSPLFLAASCGHKEIVEYLLQSSTVDKDSTDSNNRTALHWAAQYGHQEVVSVLVVAGADVNIPNLAGNTALHFSASRGHLNAVKALVEAGADITIANARGDTPSMLAIRNGQYAVHEWLQRYKATHKLIPLTSTNEKLKTHASTSKNLIPVSLISGNHNHR